MRDSRLVVNISGTSEIELYDHRKGSTGFFTFFHTLESPYCIKGVVGEFPVANAFTYLGRVTPWRPNPEILQYVPLGDPLRDLVFLGKNEMGLTLSMPDRFFTPASCIFSRDVLVARPLRPLYVEEASQVMAGCTGLWGLVEDDTPQ